MTQPEPLPGIGDLDQVHAANRDTLTKLITASRACLTQYGEVRGEVELAAAILAAYQGDAVAIAAIAATAIQRLATTGEQP